MPDIFDRIGAPKADPQEDIFDQVATATEDIFDETTTKRGILRSPKEALQELGEIFPVKERYLGVISKRPIQIMGEEISEGMGTAYDELKRGIKEGSSFGGDVKGAMGLLQAAYAPITGVTRAWAREPAEKIAERMGAPPTVSKVVGIAAELAPQIAAPAGIYRKALFPALKGIVGGKGQIGKTVAREWPSAVRNIKKALDEALPLRGEQARLYSQELGKRIGKVREVGEKLSGREAYYAQLKALKGELPKLKKPDFESIADKIKEKDVVDILNMVEGSPNLLPLEKVSAKAGLLELLSPAGGRVPQKSKIELLRRAFPDEFVEPIDELIKTLIAQQPLLRRMSEFGVEAINVPRTLMASVDLSAAFRQGIFAGPSHPVYFSKAFGSQFKYAFSEKSYRKLMQSIQESDNFSLARKAGLAFTDLGGLNAEEAYMGAQLAEKIPLVGRVVRGSNRAYTGFLNKFRMDLFNDFIKKNPGLVDNVKAMDDLTAFVNAATGRGNLYGVFDKGKSILNAGFFSPRLMASRLKLLNPGYYLNPKLTPAVRKEAIRSLLSFAGTGMSILALADLIPGVEVGLNWNNANFGKIRVGNIRIDIWGGFQQYARLAGQLISGKMISSTTGREYSLGEGYKPTTRMDIIYRFLESKENPVLSFVTGLIKGQDFIGDEFNVPAEMANRLVPIMASMVVQDLYDLYKEGGLKDVPWAIPAVFGVGVQTYGKKIPKLGVTEAGNVKLKTENVSGLGEDFINLLTGKKATNIPEELHEDLVKTIEAKSQARYEKQRLRSKANERKKKIIEELLNK